MNGTGQEILSKDPKDVEGFFERIMAGESLRILQDSPVRIPVKDLRNVSIDRHLNEWDWSRDPKESLDILVRDLESLKGSFRGILLGVS